jgi:hypothetical protein
VFAAECTAMHGAVGAHSLESEHAESVTAKARAMDARKCHLMRKARKTDGIRLTSELPPTSRLRMRSRGISQPRTVTAACRLPESRRRADETSESRRELHLGGEVRSKHR